ncbi:hypothetical protein [Anoxybacteroides amylolyticum]|nr:hypothetical protein [Anoxybacillus amylolyticus]
MMKWLDIIEKLCSIAGFVLATIAFMEGRNQKKKRRSKKKRRR